MGRYGRRSRGRRFSGAAGGREWRKGSFRQIACPRVDEARALYERNLWGTSVAEIAVRSIPTVAVDLFRDPDGVVAVARCEKCGGRWEAILDGRPRAELGAGDRWQQIEEQVKDFRGLVLDQWAPDHAACADHPMEFHTPQLAEEFVDATIKAARIDIAKGKPWLGHVSILTSDDKAISYPIHDVPPSSSTDNRREAEMIARKNVARNLIAARDLDVVAVVAVGEAWASTNEVEVCPWMDPDRSEMLVAAVVTPSFGRMGMMTVTRARGVGGEGPGTVGDINWRPLTGKWLLMDGLCATSSGEPFDPERRRRHRGIDLGPPSST